MVGGPVLAELFTYQYRPFRHSKNNADGGFKIAIFGNGTLVYTTFSRAQVPMTRYSFPISQDVLMRYMSLLNIESWWISRMPLNISKPFTPGYTSYVGVTGHPMFSVDDLMDTSQLPFNSERGLLARRLVMLLENVSEMLIPCGLYVTPNSFLWDNRVTGPTIMGEQAM